MNEMILRKNLWFLKISLWIFMILSFSHLVTSQWHWAQEIPIKILLKIDQNPSMSNLLMWYSQILIYQNFLNDVENLSMIKFAFILIWLPGHFTVPVNAERCSCIVVQYKILTPHYFYSIIHFLQEYHL